MQQVKNSSFDNGSRRKSQVTRLISFFKSKKYLEAKGLAKKILEENHRHTLSWRIIGMIYMREKNYQKSVYAHQQVTLFSPKDSEAFYNLGLAQNSLGASESAEASYKRALEIKPEFWQAHYNLATIYKETNRCGAAVMHYEASVDYAPNSADAHYGLGTALFRLRKLDLALESFNNAAHLRENFDLAISGQGQILMAKGLHKEGLEKLKSADGVIRFDLESGMTIV